MEGVRGELFLISASQPNGCGLVIMPCMSTVGFPCVSIKISYRLSKGHKLLIFLFLVTILSLQCSQNSLIFNICFETETVVVAFAHCLFIFSCFTNLLQCNVNFSLIYIIQNKKHKRIILSLIENMNTTIEQSIHKYTKLMLKNISLIKD